MTRVELDIAPTVCRYDGCTLGPDGGPAPLVQPLRGGNIREYCSDRHRIAAHRARQRRPVTPTAGWAANAASLANGSRDFTGSGPPSAVAVALAGLAGDLGRLSTEVDRALAAADADRVARDLQDARLRIAEAETRAAATAAERDREQAAAAHFRELADLNLTKAERAITRADDTEAARDAAQEALAAAERAGEELGAALACAKSDRDDAMEAVTSLETAHTAALAAQRAADLRAAALEESLAAADRLVEDAERRARVAETTAEKAERRVERVEALRAAAEERARAAEARLADAIRDADVARERASAAEALRDAALKEAQTERARAEEALSARRDLAVALQRRPASGNGNGRPRGEPAVPKSR
jgi:chromosome segregation ATPase